MAVDILMRKLKIPSKFVPYLEKHRIYELFYDLGNELAMSKPDDSLSVIKECLERSGRVRDKRLVVIIAPSHFDRIKLAHLLSAKTGYGMLSRHIMCGKSGKDTDALALAVNTAKHISSSYKEGWIFVDYPETKQEAKMLIKQQVIPTHTFLLENNDNINLSSENVDFQYSNVSPFAVTESDKNTFELKQIFKSSLKFVNTKGRSLEDIASLCAQLTLNMTQRRAPKLFRVALIGPKGSRRRTIAKRLQEKYNLVHVDMFDLINTARRLANDLGDEIKRLEKFNIPFPNKLIIDLLKSRLGCKDCLERGYVLTNYPRSHEDFVLLDSTETPPNKVIFFHIESHVCKQRLEDRVVNMHTGEVQSKKSISGTQLKNQFLTHPDEEPCVVEEDLKFYENHVGDLMEYCKKTGHVISCEGTVDTLLQKVEYVLMSPALTANARLGRIDEEKSTCNYGQQILNIAIPHPISRTQVVPLIDSEELICRFRELKKCPRQSRFLEDFEKYSRSSNVSIENDQPHEFKNNVASNAISYFTGVESSFQSENMSYFCGKFLNMDDDIICTGEECPIVNEGVYCTCEEPLFLD